MPQVFPALRQRNFRIFFIGQLLGAMGSWVQLVAMGWLTYRITGSVFMLGLVGFAGQIAMLFLAPVGGMLADRFDRRLLIMINQILIALQAVLLAVLTATDAVQPWHLVALAFIVGLFYTFDAPVRQSLPIQLIKDSRDLPNAIALVTVTANTARLVGPSIGGVLVALVGEAGCFLINAASYLMVFLTISMLRIPRHPPQKHAAAMRAIQDGFRYAAATPTIRAILLFLATVAFFATAYLVLMPYFAREVFGAGPETMGLLLSAAGLGSLAGSFYLVVYKRADRLPRLMCRSVAASGVALACFPFAPWLWLGALVLVPVGFGVVLAATAGNTLLQSLVREDMRGRVMSLFVMFYYGMMPVGSLATGLLADLFGAMATLAVFGLVTTAAALAMLRVSARLNWGRRAP